MKALKKEEDTCLLERLNTAITQAEKIGLSREVATITMMAMEMQILENRIKALEEEKKQLVVPKTGFY